IVPLLSPYSATRECTSYTTVDGKGIYGAVTWPHETPPPEYALIREMVEESIRQRRLGLLLTLHSWQGQSPFSGLETIRSAGPNRLEGEREAWARQTLDTLIANVPAGKASFPERIWTPGPARDYLLARHNAITFRVEVTTVKQSLSGLHETGRAFLENLTRVEDWGPVLPA
ncbi:MAG: hypothetical protein QHJ73_13865, partial [Armatimonadota bacterium]|nr:hypothetical protein [Armatimonadota bacterium]